jgi:hypothetical protein
MAARIRIILAFAIALAWAQPPCDGLYTSQNQHGIGHSIAAAPFNDSIWSLGTDQIPGGYVLRKWTGSGWQD